MCAVPLSASHCLRLNCPRLRSGREREQVRANSTVSRHLGRYSLAGHNSITAAGQFIAKFALSLMKALLIESGDLGELVCAFEPRHSIRPKGMAQSFSRLARVRVGIDACPADRNQIRQRIEIDGQRRAAVLAPVAMDFVGAVKRLQVTALGPAQGCLREN